MTFFQRNSEPATAWDTYQTTEHKSSLSHELIAAAAAFEGAKAYGKHVEEYGKPESHEKAREIFAAGAGAFIDHEIETRGLNALDKEKAKRQATKHFDDTYTF
ncbi:hypothetical protein BOTBODRAFT_44379 [Botryobasidium botryosum FD-172 SS1]|uniref:CipC-like antibiotic response protein n=1 Tax=Botryobasidium botryosum (strain FD-172 SS1) TaxID=930990 RepID=A0A067MTJ0_BOTB1|nr:hypothetical protein BOTBODRAFT_44379 [Botryobasidium botryosum FD-172 SS1]